MDTVGRDELVGELNALLEAERAGARVGASLVSEAPDDGLKALSKVIQADEVKWAKALFDALVDLKAEPSDQVGDFYQKAMAVPDFQDRLAFTNRGQGWVVRKLQALVPRIEDEGLHGVLQSMLDAHVLNIASANEALREHGYVAPTRAPS
jgi:nitronate monooxygenase